MKKEDIEKRIKKMRRWYKVAKHRYKAGLERLHAFIYYLYTQGYTRRELGELFDLTEQQIGRIVRKMSIREYDNDRGKLDKKTIESIKRFVESNGDYMEFKVGKTYYQISRSQKYE